MILDRATFYQGARQQFGRLDQHQVDGFEAILNTADPHRFCQSHLAYILATAWHETGARMQPVRETFAADDQTAIIRLETAWEHGQLPWVKAPYWRRDADGRAWFGRGYVQITHRANYERLGALLGVDLVSDPGVALEPSVAARILVDGMRLGAFTGRSLANCLPGDYVNARRIINGTDRAALVADHARRFESAIVGARI